MNLNPYNNKIKGLQPFPLRTISVKTYYKEKQIHALPVDLVPLLAELLDPQLVEQLALFSPLLVELLEFLVPRARLVELPELHVPLLAELLEPLYLLLVELVDVVAQVLDIERPPSKDIRGETRGKKIF